MEWTTELLYEQNIIIQQDPDFNFLIEKLRDIFNNYNLISDDGKPVTGYSTEKIASFFLVDELWRLPMFVQKQTDIKLYQNYVIANAYITCASIVLFISYSKGDAKNWKIYLNGQYPRHSALLIMAEDNMCRCYTQQSIDNWEQFSGELDFNTLEVTVGGYKKSEHGRFGWHPHEVCIKDIDLQKVDELLGLDNYAFTSNAV